MGRISLALTLIVAGNAVAFCIIIQLLLTSDTRVLSDRKTSRFSQGIVEE